MKARLITIAKLAAYPLFYLLCLGLFGYVTFPYDRLKERLIAEFDRAQSKRPGAAQRLEIDSLDAYWFTGVEVTGARLILPPAEDASRPSFDPGGKAEPKPSVIEIAEAHARINVLPLLLGRVRVSFWASVFGGEAEGVVPIGKSGGEMEVVLSDVDLGKVEPLVATLGVPLAGTVNGKLTLDAPEGKYKKANGALELTVADVSVGDGKTKIRG
jgi:type II secretion system protein N